MPALPRASGTRKRSVVSDEVLELDAGLEFNPEHDEEFSLCCQSGRLSA